METYFANAQELWEALQEHGGVLIRDFELSHYGDEDHAAGYVLLYKGITHDIHRVNKTVEMLYNKLAAAGFENNMEFTYRDIERPDKYNGAKREAVIELYPGLHMAETDDQTAFEDQM
ncbi:hypothetical protein [Ammoniphilus sp. CFH 90114]|uniref:hypothetical protein n=1 Tax=Ammoniphilus sp. CFH 90114 TaxID=2493665 RepID=UPI00100FA3D3|nr:hypothetical protein [Ammoniphilus sp. CFH 90114]RXT06331.1 hypothetical protein EIZ39_14710 [Ammoniphilus sp. CFH 90114]